MHQCTRYGINAYNYVDKSALPRTGRASAPKAAKCI